MDYLYLRAWDSVIYTDDYLKEKHLAEAREQNAPEGAIYFDQQNNRWVLFSEVTNTSMITWVNKALKQPQKLLLPSDN